MHKNFYREDDKSRAVGPFGKLRARATESPVIPANAGIQRYTLQRMDPRIREDDKSAAGRPSTSSGPGLFTVSEPVELAGGF